MCALCEKPEVCDYPDIYSGYEGALRCLVHNGGQVAWTKVIYVKRFFGLPVGVSPAVASNEDPTNYRYFCPDGSKVPIDATTKPCTWAARPWQGYMTNGQVKNVNGVQKVSHVLHILFLFRGKEVQYATLEEAVFHLVRFQSSFRSGSKLRPPRKTRTSLDRNRMYYFFTLKRKIKPA